MKQILLNYYYSLFGYFAKKYIQKHSPYVIGVTGSIGKTSCRMMVSEVLAKNLDKVIYTSSKNFNGELGMSLSILGISDYSPHPVSVLKTLYKAYKIAFFSPKLYDVIFLEYGIDHVGEMDFLLSVVRPDISIVTKIDKVHSSQFETKNIIASEKYKLSQGTKEIAYLNYDDEFALDYFEQIGCQKVIYSSELSHESEYIEVRAGNFSLEKSNELPTSRFDFIKQSNSFFSVESNILGKENIGYIALGYDILDRLYQKFYQKSFIISHQNQNLEMQFMLQYSRFSLFEGVSNSILVDSTYNASPLSMRAMIENVLEVKNTLYPEYELVLCLGDMRELGGYSLQEHQLLAEFVSEKSQEIFVVGNEMGQYFTPKARELGLNVRHYKNSFLLGKDLRTFLGVNDKRYLVLFKGSQNTIFMEEGLKMVLQDTSNMSKICRQEDFWLKKKKKFFEM